MPYLAPFTETKTDLTVPPGLALPARTWSPDKTLYREGEPAGTLYLVRSGLLKGTFVSPRLHECVHALYGPGDLVGTAALTSAVHDEDVVTCSYAELVPMLPEQLMNHEAFCAYVIKNLCEQRRRQVLHIADREGTSDERVVRLMFRLAERFGQGPRRARILAVPLSQETLAGCCGLTRVTVNRSLGRLERAGHVVGSRGRWTLDLEALHHLTGVAFATSGVHTSVLSCGRGSRPRPGAT